MTLVSCFHSKTVNIFSFPYLCFIFAFFSSNNFSAHAPHYSYIVLKHTIVHIFHKHVIFPKGILKCCIDVGFLKFYKYLCMCGCFSFCICANKCVKVLFKILQNNKKIYFSLHFYRIFNTSYKKGLL